MNTNRVRLKYKRSDIYHVNPKDIIIKDELQKLNPRFMYDIEELTESIIQNGVREPIKIYFNDEGYPVLVHGFRRVYAVIKANERTGVDIVSIPAIAVRKTISHQDILLQHYIGNDSKPLKPIEEAKGFKQFINWGWDEKEIANKIGRLLGFVRDRLLLLDGNNDLQKAVDDNKVPTSLAKNIIQESGGDKELEKELTKEAASGKKGKKIVKAILSKKLKSVSGEQTQIDAELTMDNWADLINDAKNKSIAHLSAVAYRLLKIAISGVKIRL